MRLAYCSPLPPSKSGIADYSEALLDPLRALMDVEVFSSRTSTFDPARFDLCLYQIGNNSEHEFPYRAALEHPGVVVMHEANLHHLLAEITIKKGDWDAYVAEVAYNGDDAALAFAQRVRRLEVGPDYEGLPMVRRLLERSKGLIVHSRFVERQMRAAGFEGPVAVIPHGAWVVDGDRLGFRAHIGVDHRTPLVGIFGHLKPYKRIAEALRAFRRVVRVVPEAKMILVGERHPALPVNSLISTLGLHENVRVLGYTPIEEFVGYLSACDIVLNLRFPTVGESSGTMLRALGLGKAVLVSDVGSFSEFPDDVCLKVPVDATEEDFLFEYLSTLVSREKVRRELGERARQWVASECSWKHVARLYADFLQAVQAGQTNLSHMEQSARGGQTNLSQSEQSERSGQICLSPSPCPLPSSEPEPEPEPEPPTPEPSVEPEYLYGWAETAPARAYVDTHLTRLTKTLDITPPGDLQKRVLEMGAYLQITPALKEKLGYGEVRGCYYGPAGKVEHRVVTSVDGHRFECDIELFNAEKDRFPYADEYFSTVLCCELIEHLIEDPMFMMGEINRILKPGGHLVLTTPNIGSLRAISAILLGYHPGFFPAYIRPAKEGEEAEARHTREYTPKEIYLLLQDSGFEVTLLETGEFREQPKPELIWVTKLLDEYLLPTDLRGDGIYAVGRKTGAPRKRYPAWLYDGGE